MLLKITLFIIHFSLFSHFWNIYIKLTTTNFISFEVNQEHLKVSGPYDKEQALE